MTVIKHNRLKWAIVAILTALHPILLILLYPVMGEAANLPVFIAPVTAAFMFRFWVGFASVLTNALLTAVTFRYLTDMNSSEGWPKALGTILVMTLLCAGAEWLRRYIAQRRIIRESIEQAKKLEAIGRLAGGVAHDINNTLNAIMGSTFALRQELSCYNRRFKDIENIAAVCDRGAQLTRNLLGFARKNDYPKQLFSLNHVVKDISTLLERTSPKYIKIETFLTPQATLVHGDLSQFENAVMNFCLNSLDAMSKKGRLTLTTSRINQTIQLKIVDTGTGMDKKTKERAFEPFFSTKAPGKGTGLGLSLAYGVIRAMNGQLSLESTLNAGTVITLSFPAARDEVLEDTALQRPSDPAPRSNVLDGRCVLIIDDEPLVLRSGARMLKALGCQVLSASSGIEAITIFKKQMDVISLVIIDMVMPDQDGITVLDQILAIDSTMPCLLVSGYTRQSEDIEMLSKTETIRFLAKPYEAKQLVETVAPILDDRPSQNEPFDNTGSA